MKLIKRIVNKLSVRIITSIIILVAFLVTVIGFFGYQVFTRNMMNEMADRIQDLADTAAYDIADWPFQDYLDIGEKRMFELETSESKDLKEGESETVTQAFNSFSQTKSRLIYLGRKEDISQLGIVIPDKEKGYSEATVVYYHIIDEQAIDISPELGETISIENEDERKALRRIMEEDSIKEILVDYSAEENPTSRMTYIRPVYVGADETPSGVIMVVRSIQSVVDTQNRYVIGVSLMAAAITLVGVLLLGLHLRNRVVKPVSRITAEADRFARDGVRADRELAGDVGSITEVRVLAESIDKMEEDTMNNMDEIARMSRESERLETELTLAADLQKNVLPSGEKISERKEFDVAARMTPAREVGGDFYDFFMIDDTHLVLLIADVSDKGMGAAFFMAVSKTLIKARAGMGGSAAEIITYAEEKLSEENDNGMFVTTWLGIVDLTTGEVNACNAGHNFPAVLKSDTGEGYVLEKTVHGPPVCFLPGMGHVEYDFRLSPGDRIFLYTDGVTEAKRPDGERFGNDRLLEALNEDRTIEDESLILRVKAAVDGFAGEEPQYDDMTMVSFTFLGTMSLI